MTSNRIAIVGTGYVGLTTGACLASLGHQVTCADIDEAKVARLSSGIIPIHEEGLSTLVRDGLATGRLDFVVGAANAVPGREFVFLCVPTPQGGDDSADLSFLRAAAAEIGPHLDPDAIVINKSTVPVGSTRLVHDVIGRNDISVVSNPEFLREGSAVRDFLQPDRVVVGSDDPGAASRVATLYHRTRAPVITTDAASAETIKYAANAFLATKLSFANSLAAVCEAVDADVNDVIHGIGSDQRIGREFLNPGPGWGGSCFPKDTRAMIRIAEDAGYDFEFLRGVVAANEAQFDWASTKIARATGGDVAGLTIGVLGLTFKAGTDDLRESPSLRIIARLLESGANVRAYDPTVTGPVMPGLEVTQDAYAAASGADVLAVLTEWPEFADVDLDKVADSMAGDAVVDLRNVLDPDAVVRSGLSYTGMGRR